MGRKGEGTPKRTRGLDTRGVDGTRKIRVPLNSRGHLRWTYHSDSSFFNYCLFLRSEKNNFTFTSFLVTFTLNKSVFGTTVRDTSLDPAPPLVLVVLRTRENFKW